jgi:hypothetical protein
MKAGGLHLFGFNPDMSASRQSSAKLTRSAFFITGQPKMRHAKFFGISIELVGSKSD